MFDDVSVDPEVHLPGPRAQSYQTKSLDCALDEYKICRDGTLRVHRWDTVRLDTWSVGGLTGLNKEQADKVYHDKQMADAMPSSFLYIPRAEHRHVNKRWEIVRWTGVLNFYSSSHEHTWIEYDATFHDGVMKEVVCVAPRDG